MSLNIAILSVQGEYSESVLLHFLPTPNFFIILQTGLESQGSCLRLFFLKQSVKGASDSKNS